MVNDVKKGVLTKKIFFPCKKEGGLTKQGGFTKTSGMLVIEFPNFEYHIVLKSAHSYLSLFSLRLTLSYQNMKFVYSHLLLFIMIDLELSEYEIPKTMVHFQFFQH